MRLILLTALTMTAFAANSVLNRLAVDGRYSDPGSFAVVRVLAGAVVLTLLVLARGGHMPLRSRRRVLGAGALALYMIGFSLAYRTLDAGLGALVLFGVVQMTMFTASAVTGTRATLPQIGGALLAFAGLVWILWPGDAAAVDPVGATLMIVAGIGWAIYSLVGRTEPDALAATAANFCLALPLTFFAPLIAGTALTLTPPGLALACLSGAVTSGLGYALWYRILPDLTPSVAATIQLSVPVIALAGGLILLGETASLRFLTGALVVLSGIALSLHKARSG